ncbi:MAG: N-acetyltransferase [Gammaproteobacteria bacterium]|nr:N-acetyltransferase [Gammaproteobacteria bacterium]
MRIRPEDPSDLAAVHAVNEAAFETSAEADLVDALRGKAQPLVSLVAEVAGSVVGHILFSPVTLAGQSGHMLMGLGPMAVIPQHQRQGIGSALVREGLNRCAALGCEAVVVLGHPAYYPRFGFVPASRYGISSEYDVPDDVFMIMELQPGSLRHVSGEVSYDEAFRGV